MLFSSVSKMALLIVGASQAIAAPNNLYARNNCGVMHVTGVDLDALKYGNQCGNAPDQLCRCIDDGDMFKDSRLGNRMYCLGNGGQCDAPGMYLGNLGLDAY